MFTKGKSGNPKGGHSPKAKAITQMLTSALNEAYEGGDKSKMRAVIDAWIKAAINGELPAIMAIADRIDGKPVQESTVTIDDKRDSTDWTRDELVAFLNDAKASSNGAAKAEGSNREPDSVH
jgi:hypothetical protein